MFSFNFFSGEMTWMDYLLWGSEGSLSKVSRSSPSEFQFWRHKVMAHPILLRTNHGAIRSFLYNFKVEIRFSFMSRTGRIVSYALFHRVGQVCLGFSSDEPLFLCMLANFDWTCELFIKNCAIVFILWTISSIKLYLGEARLVYLRRPEVIELFCGQSSLLSATPRLSQLLKYWQRCRKPVLKFYVRVNIFGKPALKTPLSKLYDSARILQNLVGHFSFLYSRQ